MARKRSKTNTRKISRSKDLRFSNKRLLENQLKISEEYSRRGRAARKRINTLINIGALTPIGDQHRRGKTFKISKNILKTNLLFPNQPESDKALKRLKVCSSRKVRKEIMHATKKAGKGGQKKAKWKPESKIKC